MGAWVKTWIMDVFAEWPNVHLLRMGEACISWWILRSLLKEK
jgi:hypothetical protein